MGLIVGRTLRHYLIQSPALHLHTRVGNQNQLFYQLIINPLFGLLEKHFGTLIVAPNDQRSGNRGGMNRMATDNGFMR
ncbi:hypothetical protein HED50_22785 [Ochrobactrum oryzae]|nr:hypothetical protein [Brucella oryzae]